MNTRVYAVLIFLLALGTGVALALRLKSPENGVNIPSGVASPTSSASSSSPVIIVGGTRVAVELATSSAAIRQGLSGRARLEEDAGMLFLFPRPDFYRFWMPDMHFPIDIIWIKDGIVVDISPEASHVFDPENPVFYVPREKAEHVLEVNAGFAKRHGIDVGDPVLFRNIF